ncbi:MAG: hypothetical protein WCX79_00570 [Candidatus Paceibacterota bacterium]|jgi:hypothetical protein
MERIIEFGTVCPFEIKGVAMKLFKYAYDISYDQGCGVVLAKTKETAIEMIKQKPYYGVKDLEVEEVDIKVSQIIDHSWSE